MTRSPTHKPHPDSRCGEFDEREIVGVVFFETRCDRSEMFEFVEEAFNEVSETIEIGAERRNFDPAGHWLDAGPRAARDEVGAQVVAVVGAVGE